jgi:hypothetical protein
MNWGDIYNRYLRRGFDHGAAAFGADQWEKKQKAKRPDDAEPCRCGATTRLGCRKVECAIGAKATEAEGG